MILWRQGPAAFSFASDLWALGCILMEMASGVSPFMRPTLTETTAAVLAFDVRRLKQEKKKKKRKKKKCFSG